MKVIRRPHPLATAAAFVFMAGSLAFFAGRINAGPNPLMVPGAPTVYNGHMSMYENTDAQTIADTNWNLVYTASDWKTGDVMNGVVFEDGATDTVSGAYADAGGSPNEVTVTAAAHPFADGDCVSIVDTTNYNGIFEVRNAATNTFTIVSAFNAEVAGGTVTRGGNLTITNTGSYEVNYSASVAPATGNDVLDVVLYNGFTAGVANQLKETESRTQTKTAGNFGPHSGGGLHAFTAGDKVSLAVKNVSGGNDITVRYANVWLHLIK